MSKIDQIHIRAVMLCMSKTLKMGKEHTHTFLAHNFLNTSMDFQSAKSFGKDYQPYHQILCIKHVEDVEDRSNTHKGCNMLKMSKTSKMGKEHTHTSLLITFLIFNRFSIRKKF